MDINTQIMLLFPFLINSNPKAYISTVWIALHFLALFVTVPNALASLAFSFFGVGVTDLAINVHINYLQL